MQGAGREDTAAVPAWWQGQTGNQTRAVRASECGVTNTTQPLGWQRMSKAHLRDGRGVEASRGAVKVEGGSPRVSEKETGSGTAGRLSAWSQPWMGSGDH